MFCLSNLEHLLHLGYIFLPDFYPEKIYWWPCLLHFVDELLKRGIKDYQSIYWELLNKAGSNSTIFCTHVEDKKSCILIFHSHFNQLIWGVVRYDCTLNNDMDFIFPFLHKRFCKPCVFHYLRVHYTMYPFVIFQK